MVMRYMLDTNICIYLTKLHPPQVLKRLEALAQSSAVMSVITHAGLRAGLEIQTTHREADERVLAPLTSRIPVLAFTSTDAGTYGVLRAAVHDRSRNAMDRLIAAHALSTGVTVVTNNEADFSGRHGLVVKNWACFV